MLLDVRKGRSKLRAETVIYYLESPLDVLRILNKLAETMPNFNLAEVDRFVFRYLKDDEGNLYMITASACDPVETFPIESSIFNKDVSIGSMHELLSVVGEYEWYLCSDGCYGVLLNAYIDDENALGDIFEKLMCRGMDFNLELDNAFHVAWMPVVEDNKYILKPCCCPSYEGEDDWVSIKGEYIVDL